MAEQNADQRAFWSDQAGPIWVRQTAAMDHTLAPVLRAVLDAAVLAPGEHVLDIGCGAGTSTYEAAAQVAPGGLATGIDISETLLAAAEKRRGAGTRFLRADAQTHDFGDAKFDAMISRFGVMFFDDFTAAFRQLAKALKPRGRIAWATWADIPENPFFTLPARVAKAALGPIPKTDPDAPGPFALRDTNRLDAALQGAGFKEISIEPKPVILTPRGTSSQVADLMLEIGPAQAALSYHEADADGRARLHSALVESLTEHETPSGIRIPALINIASARKPA